MKSDQIQINDQEGNHFGATLIDIGYMEELIVLTDENTILIFDPRTGLSIKSVDIGVDGRYWIAKNQNDIVVRLIRELIRNNNARAMYHNQFSLFEPSDENQYVNYDLLLQNARK